MLVLYLYLPKLYNKSNFFFFQVSQCNGPVPRTTPPPPCPPTSRLPPPVVQQQHNYPPHTITPTTGLSVTSNSTPVVVAAPSTYVPPTLPMSYPPSLYAPYSSAPYISSMPPSVSTYCINFSWYKILVYKLYLFLYLMPLLY